MDDRKGHNNVNDGGEEEHLNWPRRIYHNVTSQSPHHSPGNPKNFIQGDFKTAWATADGPQATGTDQRNLFIERVAQHYPLSYADALRAATETAPTSTTKRSDINAAGDEGSPDYGSDGAASSSPHRHIRARHS